MAGVVSNIRVTGVNTKGVNLELMIVSVDELQVAQTNGESETTQTVTVVSEP